MKEVKKCNISGVAFTLDADAHQALSVYLDSLKNSYEGNDDGAEIIADIEARIAELILSTQDGQRVVELPLVENIIRQLGSVRDIAGEDPDRDLHHTEPRIPRRLYRDMESAKLGGVCTGIGRYFDIDPAWIRLVFFVPLLFSCFGWIPLLHWTGPMMGNLFGIFVICYFIMWFAVPPARTARQKLEMRGERITAQAIGETTAAGAAANDADYRARPIMAEVVSLFGKVMLILLKVVAGLIVFGLILTACALVIGLLAIGVSGEGVLAMPSWMSLWIPVLGIIAGLIPTTLLIYVLMCLIASRKPNGKIVLAIFLLWLASIIALSVTAINENVGRRVRDYREHARQVMTTPIVIEQDTTTLKELLEEFDSERIVDRNAEEVHINVPDKRLNITVDTKAGSLKIESAEGAVVLQDGNGGKPLPPEARKTAETDGGQTT